MTSENIYQAPQSDLETDIDLHERIFAGFWVRTAASIVDTILILLATWPILTAIYGLDYWILNSVIKGVWDILLSYVLPAVVVILFWVYKSATPGKMLFGLKVISLGENTGLSLGQSVGRYLAYYLSILPLMFGFIWVAFDKRKQGWHDKLANTAVVKTR